MQVGDIRVNLCNHVWNISDWKQVAKQLVMELEEEQAEKFVVVVQIDFKLENQKLCFIVQELG